jgi:acyl carrier protein
MELELLKAITEILELENDAQITDVFRDYDEWDSLAYLSVIALIDENYNLVIPREEFQQMKTIQDICNYVIINQTR